MYPSSFAHISRCKLHWWARFWLLSRYAFSYWGVSTPVTRSLMLCPSHDLYSLTIPAILLLTTFPDSGKHLARSTAGYVATEACKRISSTGCMFMFIAQVPCLTLMLTLYIGPFWGPLYDPYSWPLCGTF